MPNMDDYYASGHTDDDSGNSGNYGGTDFGCGWVVIVIVAIMLFSLLRSGASWDAIDSLLGLGFLAFLFARSLFR